MYLKDLIVKKISWYLIVIIIKINAPDPINNQRFGSSVSLTSSGLRIAIGGPNFTNETNTSIGIVAVYSLNSNIFDDNLVGSSDNTDKISLLDTISGSYLNEYFGSSLSLNGSGDYLIVGLLEQQHKVVRFRCLIIVIQMNGQNIQMIIYLQILIYQHQQ